MNDPATPESRTRNRRWRRRGGRLALLLILLSGLGLASFIHLSLPQTSGTLALAGLDGTVEIYRDGRGIVSIKADTARDAYYALGFVHAQDRLFQIDLQRRLGDGRLSEILGPPALPLDRQMRALSLARHAEASLAGLSPDFRAVLEAYSAGVNGFITQKRPLPLEFTLLAYHPEPWRPEDTLKIAKLLAFELSGNYRQEMLRARLSARLTPQQLDQLFPGTGPDSLAPLAPLNELYRDVPFDQLLTGLTPLVGPLPVDTAWLVDGAHSATGHPLIGRTPKRDANGPGIWYMARLDAPGLSLAGGSLAGSPFILAGYNAESAWVATPAQSDGEDLFIEQLDPADPGRYLTPEGSSPFETRIETIMVRGQDQPERITMRRTRHGPVLSDALPASAALNTTTLNTTILNTTTLNAREKPTYVVAIEAVFLADQDGSAEALWRLGQTKTWADTVRAVDHYLAPPLTLLYAERGGTIGSLVLGATPVRSSGDGRAPVPGWTGAFDWSIVEPTSRQVPVLNPPDGQILVHEAALPVQPGTGTVPHRDDRTRMGDGTDRAARAFVNAPSTPNNAKPGMAPPSHDAPSPSAATLLPLLLAVPPHDNRQRAAHALLGVWDQIINTDRPQSALFITWVKYLGQRIYADELGALFPEYRRLNPGFVSDVLTKYPQWCDQLTTPDLETCDDLINLALDDALDELTTHQGNAMDGWRLEMGPTSRLHHPALTGMPFIGFFFRANGDPDDTIEPGLPGGLSIANLVSPRIDIYGAGVRSLLDLSDLDRSVFMIASGQSAHLLSPHYADLLPQWRAFEWLRLPRLAKGDPLTLVPIHD